MTYSEAVATRTKELLFKNNQTQYRLIKDTMLTKTALRKILKGQTKDINLSTIREIADFFHLSLSEFLDHEVFKSENLDL